MNEIVIVLGAAVLNFCLSCLYFVVKFPSEKTKNTNAFLISFIGSLWASYGLFLIIKHIRPNDLYELLGISIGAWICILMALASKHYAFDKRSLRAFVKNYLIDLAGLIVMGFIIWRGI